MWHTLAFTELHTQSHLIFACEMYLRSTKHNNKHCKYIFPAFFPCFFFASVSNFIYASCYSSFAVFRLRLSLSILLVLVFIIIAYIIQLSTRRRKKIEKMKCSVFRGWWNIFTLASEKANHRISQKVYQKQETITFNP